MQIISTIAELRTRLADERAVAFVPTMGNLHEGHLNLVRLARAQHPQSTLADLYNPDTMPDDLRAAHKALDKAVDAAYLADGGQKKWADDSERVAFLFRRYEALTSLLAGR